MGVSRCRVGTAFTMSITHSVGKYFLITLLCVWLLSMSWLTMLSKGATVPAVVGVMVRGVIIMKQSTTKC